MEEIATLRNKLQLQEIEFRTKLLKKNYIIQDLTSRNKDLSNNLKESMKDQDTFTRSDTDPSKLCKSDSIFENDSSFSDLPKSVTLFLKNIK
jgi:hypothetical protein